MARARARMSAGTTIMLIGLGPLVVVTGWGHHLGAALFLVSVLALGTLTVREIRRWRKIKAETIRAHATLAVRPGAAGREG
jgi:hypothetical protein